MDLTNEAVVGGGERTAMELSRLSATEKQILIFSFYRDAELRGARLLFNMFGHLQDADSQLKLSKHLADETRHAWLWTRRIADLGGAPLMLADGYQRRLGARLGIAKGIVELLGLTAVAAGTAGATGLVEGLLLLVVVVGAAESVSMPLLLVQLSVVVGVAPWVPVTPAFEGSSPSTTGTSMTLSWPVTDEWA